MLGKGVCTPKKSTYFYKGNSVAVYCELFTLKNGIMQGRKLNALKIALAKIVYHQEI
jgi:hypothetical protein